jgi:hypothetical protein
MPRHLFETKKTLSKANKNQLPALHYRSDHFFNIKKLSVANVFSSRKKFKLCGSDPI